MYFNTRYSRSYTRYDGKKLLLRLAESFHDLRNMKSTITYLFYLLRQPTQGTREASCSAISLWFVVVADNLSLASRLPYFEMNRSTSLLKAVPNPQFRQLSGNWSTICNDIYAEILTFNRKFCPYFGNLELLTEMWCLILLRTIKVVLLKFLLHAYYIVVANHLANRVYRKV